jgi:hypothetical protein
MAWHHTICLCRACTRWRFSCWPGPRRCFVLHVTALSPGRASLEGGGHLEPPLGLGLVPLQPGRPLQRRRPHHLAARGAHRQRQRHLQRSEHVLQRDLGLRVAETREYRLSHAHWQKNQKRLLHPAGVCLATWGPWLQIPTWGPRSCMAVTLQQTLTTDTGASLTLSVHQRPALPGAQAAARQPRPRRSTSPSPAALATSRLGAAAAGSRGGGGKRVRVN